MKLKKYFDVSIRADALAKIWNWVHLCKEEISGLGTVEKIGNKYVIDEVYLYKQVVTGQDTELDSGSVAAFMESISEKKRRRLRFWWHSHADMSTFWSSTDEECIKTLLQDDYIISTVFNHKEEHLTRVDVKSFWPMTIDGIEIATEEAGFGSQAQAQEFVDQVFPIEDLKEFKEKSKIIETLGKGQIYREVFKDFCEEEFKEKVKTKTVPNLGSYIHVKRFQRQAPHSSARSYLSIVPRKLGL